MSLATGIDCPYCGRARKEEDSLCSLCGHLFDPRSGAVSARPRPEPGVASFAPPRVRPSSDPRVLGLAEAWLYLVIGAVTAPIFAFTPLLQYMGWFLSSLTHEMGHSIIAWICGMPAYPAIRLDGHAAAFHEAQKLWLVLLVAASVGTVLWRFGAHRWRIPAVAIAVPAYLVCALTPVREPLFLIAGHCGELTFAGICLWRAFTGGFTSSPVERGLYGTLGWYLLGGNILMTLGLVFSDAARRDYAGNGSFGLTNDYLRVADDVLGVPLPLVAAFMTLVALGVLPLVLLLVRRAVRREESADSG